MIVWSLPAAILLDLALGDPQVRWHPVRLLGRWIDVCDRCLRNTGFSNRAGGIALVALVIGAATIPVALVLSNTTQPILLFFAETAVLYFSIALGSLIRISRRVRDSLVSEDLVQARNSVSEICGRDSHALDRPGVIRATIESVSENGVDGFASPVFYVICFGPLGGWIYRVVNTLDSMVGYKSEPYLRFGWASARLDDLMNYIPSRLFAGVMSFWSPLAGGRIGTTVNCVSRFARLHSSPNAGWPESAAAGALGVRLGGPVSYGGELLQKPFLGDGRLDPVPADISRANILVIASALTFAVLGVGLFLLFRILGS